MPHSIEQIHNDSDSYLTHGNHGNGVPKHQQQKTGDNSTFSPDPPVLLGFFSGENNEDDQIFATTSSLVLKINGFLSTPKGTQVTVYDIISASITSWKPRKPF